jgi:hypothetical protein
MSPTVKKVERKSSPSPKAGGSFTKKVKHYPTIYAPQKSSVWNIMRKQDPRMSPDNHSEMKSTLSNNEKHELSFGKDLIKDDDNLSQLTYKS